MFLPDEGSVDTGQLLTALDEALAKHPRVTVVDARATCISMDSGPGLSVQTTSDTINGQFVLLAGGAEISQLLAASALSHLEVPVMFSGRGVILLISSATHLPYAVRTPNRGFACGLHVVPRSGEQIYLGATNRLSTTPDFEQQATLSEIKGVSKGECLEERGGVK